VKEIVPALLLDGIEVIILKLADRLHGGVPIPRPWNHLRNGRHFGNEDLDILADQRVEFWGRWSVSDSRFLRMGIVFMDVSSRFHRNPESTVGQAVPEGDAPIRREPFGLAEKWRRVG
jgi:hypothetical protein